MDPVFVIPEHRRGGMKREAGVAEKERPLGRRRVKHALTARVLAGRTTCGLLIGYVDMYL